MIGIPRRLWILSTLVACCSGSVPAIPFEDKDADALFREGNGLFQEGNEMANPDRAAAELLYQRAVLRYERIVRDEGIRNGKLFYNIGNAYFRMNDLGRAILNYNRAKLYTPHDPNLKQNLDFARSRRLDDIPAPQSRKILQTLFFWHYDISTRIRSVVFLSGFFLCWIALGARLVAQRPIFSRVAWTGAVVAGLFLASLSIEALARQRSNLGIVVDTSVVARKGNSASYEPSFTEPLHAGTEFNILEERSDWVHVELMDGHRSWLPNMAIERVRLPGPGASPLLTEK